MIALDGFGIRQGDFELRDVTFVVPSGSYGVLMGRSGSGKSTVLEAICGLRPRVHGRILLDGRAVMGLRPGERGVGYVPQDRALFPTLRVRDQLAFALVVRRAREERIAARVEELAALLGIRHLLDRNGDTLSGGEAQRVTLGRALAADPSVLCLDEPLSALDEDTHDEICRLLADVHSHTGTTVLHVTHSWSEARRLADRILLIEDGRVQEVDGGGGGETGIAG